MNEDWRRRHREAMLRPTEVEEPLVQLIRAAETLVEQHGEDMVLRHAPLHALQALRVMLDGDLGRLDGGLIAGFIERTMEAMGYDPDRERWTDG